MWGTSCCPLLLVSDRGHRKHDHKQLKQHLVLQPKTVTGDTVNCASLIPQAPGTTCFLLTSEPMSRQIGHRTKLLAGGVL